jgi:hypothetical protein
LRKWITASPADQQVSESASQRLPGRTPFCSGMESKEASLARSPRWEAMSFENFGIALDIKNETVQYCLGFSRRK